MTPDTSKATGRPWRVCEGYDGLLTRVSDATERNGIPGLVAMALTEADAALIVERVNGWDALVAERDALRILLRDLLNHRPDSGGGLICAYSGSGAFHCEDDRHAPPLCAVCAARAALGKGGAA